MDCMLIWYRKKLVFNLSPSLRAVPPVAHSPLTLDVLSTLCYITTYIVKFFALFFFSNQTNLSAMQEDLLAALENKNPSVKEETIRFLVRCFSKSTPAALPKTFLKPVCSSLLKVRAYCMKYYMQTVVGIVYSETAVTART